AVFPMLEHRFESGGPMLELQIRCFRGSFRCSGWGLSCGVGGAAGGGGRRWFPVPPGGDFGNFRAGGEGDAEGGSWEEGAGVGRGGGRGGWQPRILRFTIHDLRFAIGLRGPLASARGT